MKLAYCTVDTQLWECDKFADLPAAELALKRNNLLCPECKQFAWFRKTSVHGHPAHFCAHHLENCSLKTEYELINDQELADEEIAGKANQQDIVVDLTNPDGGNVEVDARSKQPETEPHEGGLKHVYARDETDQHKRENFKLRRLLHRLTKSSDFANSTKIIEFIGIEGRPLISGRIRDIVVNFKNISDSDLVANQVKFYWGPIASVGETSDGKMWLNSSGDNKDASFAITEDIKEEFISTFNITDKEDDLLGAWVLAAGYCRRAANTGKPVIWCNVLNYIVVRKYHDPYLKA